ncbi:hypothetical protein [Candidatus Magnetominusculus xianensis]|uniref:Uncharacterized protein n=1 Tax=Candidatus Magnetominusculus xianensis TaxID=1748249 RepID=A0ABR5SCI6_9BACT|nr:hypothetical protein [Candidatus Magnetominusculus xianensis]KWT77379.1 hypothetical protein ASN18_3022 [Candidatus Magnetominusculus xianensis]MBF0405189.1 hypothetical protein [Nitrospirota bacterium]
MAEIEGSDDFQQMLTRLKQRVNNIAAVKATVATQDTGGDVKELLVNFAETLKKGFTALLDGKSGELEILSSIAAGALDFKKAGESTATELKKEINSTLNTMLSDFKGRLEGALKDDIRSASMSVKDEIASVKSTIPYLDINAIGSKLNNIGGAVESLSITLKNTFEHMKTTTAIDDDTKRVLIQEIKQTAGDSISAKIDAALAPLRGEISSLKAVITTLKVEPTASGADFSRSYIDSIRSEFSSEIREIKALVEKENNAVKSQTLEFLGFVTDKIVGLHGKIDKIVRPALAPPGTLSPNVSERITEGISSGLQREIAPVMDGLVHIIRFLIALSKR